MSSLRADDAMNTCDTCKWWKPTPHRSATVKFGHRCESDKLYEDGDNDQPEDALMYPYFEGGSFYPGPKFGCVHWAEKENP